MTYEIAGYTPFRSTTDRTHVRRAADRERRVLGVDINTVLLAAEVSDLTRAELLIVAPVPAQVPLPTEVFDELRGRDVKVRVLFGSGTQPLTDPVATLAREGIALPAPLALPHFLLVRDRTAVYLPQQDPGRPGNGRLTRVHSVVMGDSLATAWGLMWDTASRRARHARTAATVDDGEELIRALSDGLTDDQAAATLHMSRRTFARRASEMMHRLHARTRFQAGVHAARRGWV